MPLKRNRVYALDIRILSCFYKCCKKHIISTRIGQAIL